MRKCWVCFFLLGLGGCAKPLSEPAPPSPPATETPGSPAALARGEGLFPDETLPTGPLAGKKVVMIIAHRDFRDEELAEPKKILEGRGAKVVVASSSMDEAKGMRGAKVMPDLLLDNLDASDYDGVIYVGGSGAKEYWDHEKAHQIAREAVAEGKVLGALCLAPVTLANAGVLKGKRATVWESEGPRLKEKGAEYTGASVEVDGRIITGNGPQASSEFGWKVAAALEK